MCGAVGFALGFLEDCWKNLDTTLTEAVCAFFCFVCKTAILTVDEIVYINFHLWFDTESMVELLQWTVPGMTQVGQSEGTQDVSFFLCCECFSQ
mgnify:CR=1 FL=1